MALVELVEDLAPYFRMQWRGSTDGIVWTEWSELPPSDMLLPNRADGEPWFAVQARIWIDGRWNVSRMATY